MMLLNIDLTQMRLIRSHSKTNFYSRAAHEMWKDSIKIYQCVDVSHDMNETAEYLLRSNLEVSEVLNFKLDEA